MFSLILYENNQGRPHIELVVIRGVARDSSDLSVPFYEWLANVVHTAVHERTNVRVSSVYNIF